MSVQNRTDNQIPVFELAGDPKRDDSATLAQDGARSEPLAKNTLLVLDPATDKWEPFTDETAVDGTELPRGILASDDVPAADLVAGDVENVVVTRADLIFNENQLIIENSKTLATVITSATCSVRSWLIGLGLISESAGYYDRGENS